MANYQIVFVLKHVLVVALPVSLHIGRDVLGLVGSVASSPSVYNLSDAFSSSAHDERTVQYAWDSSDTTTTRCVQTEACTG